MGEIALIVGAVTAAAILFWHWLHRWVQTPTMSGDKWYIRQMAFTDDAVSAPYCWRPLVPWIARWTGFIPLSHAASFATPLVAFFWLGGDWAAAWCALIYVGVSHLLPFNVRNPEYIESVGHLLLLCGLWAMQAGSWWAFPVFLLAALCRETIAAALGAIALFWNPWLLIPLTLGSAVAWFGRREDKRNLHPLVEKTPYETLYRWAKHKEGGIVCYAHTVQPLRGTPLAVPFMWNGVGDFARLGLVAIIPVWLLAIPASGQSRIMCYTLPVFLPFVHAAGVEWAALFCFLAWFWPFDLNAFDERGGSSFSVAR